MTDPLARALAARNYNDPTPVQSAVLDSNAADRDLLVSAQTGSGKTVAYGLAIAANLLDDAGRIAKAQDSVVHPVALVVAPTRELALQVHLELTWLYEHTGARVVCCVGGMDARSEQRKLADGADIVVGTPGRLRDHLRRRALKVHALKAVVLDEADEMLNLGFREDMEFILDATPSERRTLLFSATLPKDIVSLAKRYQRDAARIEVSGEGRGHADIEYRVMRILPDEIQHAVVNVLRFIESPTALVFCNTRDAVKRLQAALLERGFSVVSLSGELSQSERNTALQALRDGRARVCVATDVAARGIDLPGLELVIHADLPHDAEILQHRSGRTGRAGRKGVSVLLVPSARRYRAEQLLATADVKRVWSGPPSADEIRALDQTRLLKDDLFRDEPGEDDLVTAAALLQQRSPESIAAALVRLYRARLPAPEDVTDPGFGREPRDEKGPHKGARDRGTRDHSAQNNGAPEHGSQDGAQPRKSGVRKDGAQRSGETVWFRINTGKANDAEARRLLPMICRRGKITREDIGAIRIFDRDTKFEVAEEIAIDFALAVSRSAAGDFQIEPTTAPQRDHEQKRSSGGKPSSGKPSGHKPSGDKHRPKAHGASYKDRDSAARPKGASWAKKKFAFKPKPSGGKSRGL